MSSSHILAPGSGPGSGDFGAPAHRAAPVPRLRTGAAQRVGLWVFMAVVTVLFSLFLAAYLMRVSAGDATAIAMPWQLWLSTAWLLAGSAALQRSAVLSGQGRPAQALLLTSGGCALGFIATQWWAWASLLAAQVSLTGNPAGSFFYMLTALHVLHVVGGLAAWVMVVRAAAHGASTGDNTWRIELCARYWHFLLAVWLVLFAAFSLITPELAALICGTR